MPDFNLIGLAMLAGSFGVALGIVTLLGIPDEALLLILAGALAFVIDVTYRWRHPAGHWFHAAGGSLCHLPIWLFGLLWVVLNVGFVLTGTHPSEVPVWLVVGLFGLVIGGAWALQNVRDEPTSSPAPATPDWQCSRCGHPNSGGVRTCKKCRLQI